MFRAQWMFELAPGVGTSAVEARPGRAARGAVLKAAADARGKQELAKEEKLSMKDPSTHFLSFFLFEEGGTGTFNNIRK